MFLRSRRERDGKPLVSGVGARVTKRGVRVDVLHVAAPVRAGRLRTYLHTRDTRESVTVLVPALKAGAYQDCTLEVAA